MGDQASSVVASDDGLDGGCVAIEAAAVTAGVTVEGSALPRRVETTSDSVGRLNTLVNGGTGPGNGERSRGTATVVCIYVYSSTAQTNSW